MLFNNTPTDQTGEAATQSYINALFLNSYEEKHFLIITQSPLSETVADFWQMIYETNPLCVINMNHIDLMNTSCASYIPREEKSLAGNFDVELLNTESHEHFDIKRLKLIYNSLAKEEIREILHYRFKSWKACDRVPTPRDSILEIVQNIRRVRGSVVKTPIIIHCADGASQSGLLGACFILHEIFLRDKSIDIFHVIKYLKSKRFPFINSYVSQNFYCLNKKSLIHHNSYDFDIGSIQFLFQIPLGCREQAITFLKELTKIVTKTKESSKKNDICDEH